MGNIELSEMIGQLRKELLIARDEIQGSDLKFRVDDIEIELQIVTSKGANGGIKFFVEAGGNVSQAQTQKLKLKLKPMVGLDNKLLDVTDEDDLGEA